MKISLLPMLLTFYCCFLNVSSSYSMQNKQLTLKLGSKITQVALVDSKFLSFTIDSHGLAEGWKNIDLENKQLVYLAKNLHPAYLRIGGTDADIIQFVPERPLDSFEGTINEVKYHHQSCRTDALQDSDYRKPSNSTAYVPAKDILAIGSFIEKTKVELIYDLNVLLRTKNGRKWDPTNARELMKFMSTSGIKVSGWELGNEPNSFQHAFNVTLKSNYLAEDFSAMKNLTKSFSMFNCSKIIGPDVTRPTGKRSRSIKYLKGFLKNGGGKTVDKVTFHQYYFDGSNSSENDFINVTTMNALQAQIKQIASAVNRFAPGKSIWIGETGSGWGGGCKNVSDRYASSFLWLDKLGISARYGVEVVFRQTLMGGAYGMVDSCGTPTPDYYISVLHKRLVGTQVLEASLETSESINSGSLGPPGVRLYFHCTRSAAGSLTVFGINVEKVDAQIKFPGLRGQMIHEYLLQAPELTSRYSYLNGIILRLNLDGTLPALEPVKRKSHILIPSLSMGFWVLPHANLSMCQ
ncbi:unnamed protein product [Allacma fusca]|uniref:Uncharacterized protein n=1 Tax=Allacma fusca TaxID=39272 RepID=A0A8J2L639_9HEXA|nr:unnamed protein product [Allacma fusca]